jgi:transposase
MYCVGIDVHMKHSVVDIFDPTAELGRQHRTVTVSTTREGLSSALAPLGGRCRVAYEVGTSAQWVAEVVRPLAREVKVANPSQMPWLFRSGKKNDQIDARKLSTLLHLDQLPTVHLPSAEVSAWRSLINFRRTLVVRQTQIKNQIQSILRTFARRCPHRSVWSRLGLKWLLEQTFDEIRDAMIASLLEELGSVKRRRETIETSLESIAARHPAVARLRTIPGVGPRTAEAVVAFADDVSRFARSRQFACYFGLTPTLDASGDRVRHGHISKRGPSVVRWVLVEAVHTTLRHCPPLRAMFERIHRGKPDRRKKAIVAVGRKLLTIMFAMLRQGVDFDASRLAGAARPSGARSSGPRGHDFFTSDPPLGVRGIAGEKIMPERGHGRMTASGKIVPERRG